VLDDDHEVVDQCETGRRRAQLVWVRHELEQEASVAHGPQHVELGERFCGLPHGTHASEPGGR
jgi:hypothetical protein